MVVGVRGHAACIVVRRGYERHLHDLGIRGEGLAVGVVTEVGLTEEP